MAFSIAATYALIGVGIRRLSEQNSFVETRSLRAFAAAITGHDDRLLLLFVAAIGAVLFFVRGQLIVLDWNGLGLQFVNLGHRAQIQTG